MNTGAHTVTSPEFHIFAICTYLEEFRFQELLVYGSTPGITAWFTRF
jgi:hypothetical protein